MEFSALLTDLYQLTMAACYFEEGMAEEATFSLFVRRLPQNRAFLVAAGLDEALRYLESFHFRQEDLAYLERLGLFKSKFLQFLEGLRFTGQAAALPEGSIFFANEPIIEITAPIIEAQLVETYLLNIFNIQTMVATKAARCLLAAPDKTLVDFAARRTQGADASLKVARASYLAGFAATSNVLAGKLFGLPVVGTMAHSFIESFPREIDAFRSFARLFPEKTVLLIDTYDTLAAAQKAVAVAKELAAKGYRMLGVRLDSGDIASLAKEVRRILNEAGLNYVKIFVSGGLDEFAIRDLLDQGAPIDAFGVGTKMGVSADAPYLDSAYKLVRYGRRPVAKLSVGKATLAGDKQVFRKVEDGQMIEDLIGLREEAIPEATPLLVPVMKDGKRIFFEDLATSRARFQQELSQLPEGLKALSPPFPTYPVRLTEALSHLQEEVRQRLLKETEHSKF
ncbi:nicotinate phosphoribosyltransferase [Thermosulfuriphilus ammonigenes]|uniref:Nicotinate phosphoribosyltransferase n=1 Tax=Thermosulfuriphilus ammonigenes TaxID=1936021 RepID=A0A6G7PWA3_9BACT|nr:nicotinate phosphoribosyltransferase [Thermosulfuriphilus ammonigenes]MBA2848092.1 nicotinate phosphoribosyltransferase [Thermosulfuriphilus ammonigenes]QIJ71728.1 nicotinate phosphoribosyltransferase [Thermosulfuriphilus ammonigenes]